MQETVAKTTKVPILIVDDDEAQLKILASIINLEQLTPICCQTGEMALQACREQIINVAILDLRLPDMNGLDLVRQLREQNPQLKVIINTGYASLDSALAAINESVFAYVQKTGDITELIGHVHRALHLHLMNYNELLIAEVETRTKALLITNEALRSEVLERKRIEEALWNTSQRFRSLIENSNEVILIMDAEAKFRYASPALEKILGYSSEDTIGQHFSEFVVADNIAIMSKSIEEAQRQPGVSLSEFECGIRHHDGSLRTLAFTITNLFDKPNINGFLVNGYDITERKNLEDQLRQAQKMEAVGRLAGGVAHDFNNMLTVITGYAEILLSRRLAEGNPMRREVEEIKKAGERVTALTRQLLTFSRKHMFQYKTLDLNLVITNLEKMLRRLIGENVVLVTELAPNLREIKADPGQMEQIIMNLAVNARDAMPNGGQLTIRTTHINVSETYARKRLGLQAGPYILLSVIDNGIGMDAETKAHIFEPFFTTKEQGKGTGLGLSTVYGIVIQSSGYIDVETELGRHTIFNIYFPAVDEVKEVDFTEVKSSNIVGIETILLVEDEASVRELASQVLHIDGYTVLEADNGVEALKVSEQYLEKIDLLVTDVIMPGGVNGRELAEQLSKKRPDMKILYMSGYTNNAIAKHGLLDSDAAFLQKPFTLRALSTKARQVLDS